MLDHCGHYVGCCHNPYHYSVRDSRDTTRIAELEKELQAAKEESAKYKTALKALISALDS